MALNAGGLMDAGTTVVTPKTSYPGPTTQGPTTADGPHGPTTTTSPEDTAGWGGVTTKAGGDTTGAGQAQATPPVAPPDNIVTTPGFTPDYGQAIQNDPGYQSQVNANEASGAQAAAARRAALQSAVIQYGGLTPGFKDQYGDIDQATLDAAKNNQYSTISQLQRNYQQSVNQFRKALAARGALESGDMTYGQDNLDTGYGQNLYDAGNAFGNTATGAVNQYVGVLGQNAQALTGAIQTAEGNAYNDPMNRPVEQKTATHDAGLSATYGQDIYKGDDGTYYTRDGTVFIPPSTPTDGSPYSGGPAGSPYGGGAYSWGLGGKI